MMAVFHLKYRPLKIEDLDLVEVVNTLKKILAGKEIPGSFLFAGPKGAGKTSAARIVARAVNCLNPEGVEPCDKCDNCKEIVKGSSMDIMEIDAASNRGIEDIRLLKEKAYLMPSRLKRKIFIIDEVHMLTKEAFNALLKLIEEPPKHTMFILCTTDPEKIPETVLSRLIRVDFKKGNKKELKKSLKKIVTGEKIEVSDEVMDLIVEKSDGSFRNLQKTFNEIFMQLGNKIDLAAVKSFFELKSGGYEAKDFEEDLVLGDVKLILEKLERMAEAGVDFAGFRQKLLYYFQRKLLAYYGVDEVNEGSKLDSKEIQLLLNLLIKAGKQEKDVEIDQLPMELAVVEFMGDSNKTNGGNGGEKDSKKKAEKEAMGKEEIKSSIKKISKTKLIPESKPIKIAIEDIQKRWNEILVEVKPFNHSVEAFLRAARPKMVSNDELITEVFYPFHKERLEVAKNREIVESVLSKIFNEKLIFKCVLSKSRKQPLIIKNDTPIEEVNEELNKQEVGGKKDMYDVAKEIFG